MKQRTRTHTHTLSRFHFLHEQRYEMWVNMSVYDRMIPVPISTRMWVVPSLVETGDFLRFCSTKMVSGNAVCSCSLCQHVLARHVSSIDKTCMNIIRTLFSEYVRLYLENPIVISLSL